MRILTGLVLLLLSSPAWAVDCASQDPTTAEVNSREGVRLAKAGSFEEAIALFRIAVRLDACAAGHQLLLARALARNRQAAEARALYTAVIKNYPETPESARAKRELEQLDTTPVAMEPPPPTEPIGEPGETLAAPPPPKDEMPWDIIGYSVVGAGALAVVGGVIFALDAQSADDDLVMAAHQPDRAHYDELVDQRDSSSTLAYALYGVGGAMIVGGAVMAFLLPNRPSTGESTAIGLGPVNDGLLIQLGGEF